MATIRPRVPQPTFDIHHDDMEESMEEENHQMEESAIDDEEDGDSEASYSDDEVDAIVQEDLRKFQESFEGIHDRFRLIKRIGEGKMMLIRLITF